MNKAELAAVVAQKTGITKKDAEAAVTATFAGIVDALKEGDKVHLVGFGSFVVKERQARTGHNPATGAKIDIPASNVPTFKAGKLFKDALN